MEKVKSAKRLQLSLKFIGSTVVLSLFLFSACHSKNAMEQEITVQELKTKQAAGASFLLLDVREPEEVAIVQLPNSVHIPMGEIPGRVHELDPEKEIVVYCHHGVRSLRVANFLLQRDFAHVKSLAGGIDAWSLEIDPALPRY